MKSIASGKSKCLISTPGHNEAFVGTCETFHAGINQPNSLPTTNPEGCAGVQFCERMNSAGNGVGVCNLGV